MKRNNKKVNRILGKISKSVKINEHVTPCDEPISDKDSERIAKIISQHFFFSSFNKRKQKDLVWKMKMFKAQKGQIIFKQKDPGSLFFVIKKGKVTILINDIKVKTLEKGDSFGELSLLYTAPRSASAIAEADCQFWSLHQSDFLLYNE